MVLGGDPQELAVGLRRRGSAIATATVAATPSARSTDRIIPL
jgi:hypothetical protein